MKRIFTRGILPHKLTASVAAIGVFDGVHLGHQKVIARAVADARRLGVPSVVVTFHPHPVAVLRPKGFSPYIMSLPHRLQLIEELGVDMAVVLDFDKRLAARQPEQFVRDFLVGQLGVRKVIIGRDFHFGCGAKGSTTLLQDLGRKYGFVVQQIKLLKNINKNIKSRFIKQLIAEGDLFSLKRFLGRPYTFLGEVEKGDARGRRLGYRTANLKKENVIILPSGIYLVRARCGKVSRERVRWDDQSHPGLCYIGRRPTFKKANAPVVQELHFLDHDADLYGRKILMEFIKKVRDDRYFSDEKDLVAQIARDVLQARRFFQVKRVHP